MIYLCCNVIWLLHPGKSKRRKRRDPPVTKGTLGHFSLGHRSLSHVDSISWKATWPDRSIPVVAASHNLPNSSPAAWQQLQPTGNQLNSNLAIIITPRPASLLPAFVGGSDIEKQIWQQDLSPKAQRRISSKTTNHLIYVYHRASIACKVNKVEVPKDRLCFELCCITIYSNKFDCDWQDLERRIRGPGRQRILASWNSWHFVKLRT